MARRRQFLVGVATAGVVTIAGCSSSGNQSETGPEMAVEQYFTEAQNANTEGVNAVLHPEAPSYPRENITAPDEEITLNEVNQVSSRELIEQRSANSNLTEQQIQQGVNRTEQSLNRVENETGVDESSIILVSWEQAGEEREQEFVVVQDDGEWYVYL